MNRLEWVEQKLEKYKKKDGKPYRNFQRKWYGISYGDILTIQSIVTLNKNILKMMMEDLK